MKLSRNIRFLYLQRTTQQKCEQYKNQGKESKDVLKDMKKESLDKIGGSI